MSSETPMTTAPRAASAARPNVLELRNVSKSFVNPDGRVVEAVKNVQLVVEDKPDVGEFRVFLGPSGCGKSTILSMLAGLYPPTSGEVVVRGEKVAGPGPDRGMVFQSYSSYPWYTVLDNVAFGLRLRGMPRAERESIARGWIKKVGLAGTENKYPKQLSGGMRQRVAIARTLACKPRIILMDEPFGALDVGTRLEMQNLINQLWEEIEGTILFVTHDISEAVYLADRIHIFSAGPGTIVDEVNVDLPLHRTEDLKESPRFRDLEDVLLHKVQKQVRGGNIRITT
jgi:ABC-type nitrate/sulfonate/bicarbonate transport system ATPase subunit